MEKKMTKKEMFGLLLGLLETVEVEEKDELVAFVGHEIELIEKKAEKAKSYKRKEKEDVLKEAVVKCLSSDEFRITSDITSDLIVDFADVTVAKVTARLSALVKEGVVIKEDVKTEDKRTLKGYKLA